MQFAAKFIHIFLPEYQFSTFSDLDLLRHFEWRGFYCVGGEDGKVFHWSRCVLCLFQPLSPLSSLFTQEMES